MEGTNPLTVSEWLWESSLSLGGNLNLENTKLLPEVLELHSSQWLHQYITPAVHHPKSLQDLYCILPFSKEYPIYTLPHLHT